ncbi:MAG: hypothetical protein ABI599_07175 [Flavobacteriales bacterium]
MLGRLPITTFLCATLFLVAFSGCRSKTAGPAGVKVDMPFTGSNYESNNRWFRGTGIGTSAKQNIARSKSDLDAKNQLAGQVGSSVRSVSDQYLGETSNTNASEVADKFQTLVRDVMSTEIADLRKVGEQTFLNEAKGEYTVHTAYEIKKAAMWRFMKKQARTQGKMDEVSLKLWEEMMDEQIKLAEAEEDK